MKYFKKYISSFLLHYDLKQTIMKKTTPLFFLLILFFITLKSNGQISSGGFGQIADNNSDLYLTGSIVFSAINVTATTFNIVKLHKYDKYRSNAIFGIISGATQTALGFANINATHKNAFIPAEINIGVGAITLATSIIRLATKNPPKEDKVAFNFYYLPISESNHPLVGINLAIHLN